MTESPSEQDERERDLQLIEEELARKPVRHGSLVSLRKLRTEPQLAAQAQAGETGRYPFFSMIQQPPADAWWVTDFTKGQLEGRLRDLEAELRTLRAKADRVLEAPRPNTGALWEVGWYAGAHYVQSLLQRPFDEAQKGQKAGGAVSGFHFDTEDDAQHDWREIAKERLNEIRSLTAERDTLKAEVDNKPKTHGWIPELIVDHDRPVCEICHGFLEEHESNALITDEYDRVVAERDTLKAKAGLADRLMGPGSVLRDLSTRREFLEWELSASEVLQALADYDSAQKASQHDM